MQAFVPESMSVRWAWTMVKAHGSITFALRALASGGLRAGSNRGRRSPGRARRGSSARRASGTRSAQARFWPDRPPAAQEADDIRSQAAAGSAPQRQHWVNCAPSVSPQAQVQSGPAGGLKRKISSARARSLSSRTQTSAWHSAGGSSPMAEERYSFRTRTRMPASSSRFFAWWTAAGCRSRRLASLRGLQSGDAHRRRRMRIVERRVQRVRGERGGVVLVELDQRVLQLRASAMRAAYGRPRTRACARRGS